MKYTYFIQEGDDGPIKIGSANNPDERLSQLQTASSRDLRLLLATTLVEERTLHAEFSEQRLKGEWFAPAARIFERIEQIKADLGKYPAHCWATDTKEDVKLSGSKPLADYQEEVKAQRYDPEYQKAPKVQIPIDPKLLGPETLETLRKLASEADLTVGEMVKAILNKAADKALAEHPLDTLLTRKEGA